MICPYCDASVELDQPVCGNCGGKLPPVKAPSMISSVLDMYNDLPLEAQRPLFGAVLVALAMTFFFWKAMLVFWAAVAVTLYLLHRARGPETLHLDD